MRKETEMKTYYTTRPIYFYSEKPNESPPILLPSQTAVCITKTGEYDPNRRLLVTCDGHQRWAWSSIDAITE